MGCRGEEAEEHGVSHDLVSMEDILVRRNQTAQHIYYGHGRANGLAGGYL
jgi:hypothetical protein